MKFLLPVAFLFATTSIFGQAQVCPLNNDFITGSLTHWEAYTGNNQTGNGPGAIKMIYDSTKGAPSGTIGVNTLYEYNLGTVPGIQVITNSSTDYFGGFPTIPTINGYKYTNSILLGSTSISRSGSGANGGYIRGVRYNIAVPAGSSTIPYTMTYAYAMVLENGTHNSSQQPLFSATLATAAGTVISCASPKYFLPTKDNADTRGTGATLDTALAQSQGIYLSARPSPNSNPNSNNPNGEHLQDVWAKGWTEVTFDLSAYRGQKVSLSFEADNCVPGGHFAYAYVALRNVCDGLLISGPALACINSTLTYSVPALTGASYTWSVPSDWLIVSGQDSNILRVKVRSNNGVVKAREVNSCADLTASLGVTTTPPTVAGFLKGNNTVCSGSNVSQLVLTNNVGSVLNWLASTNGSSYSVLPVTTLTYTAQDLATSTTFRALVQNGSSCNIDTSDAASVIVDPRSVGGTLSPGNMVFCMGQNKDALLQLQGSTGSVKNWQSSADGINWTDFSPVYNASSYNVIGITASTQYRSIVKSGVCPTDTSSISYVGLLPALFPEATAAPADTNICYGATATLNASILLGSSYSWSNASSLSGQGNGAIDALPFNIRAAANPLTTTNYVLRVLNTGCPNALLDTFHVNVHPRIVVDAGRDTAIVVNQPLQLHASASDGVTGGFYFDWTPVTGLDNPSTTDPIAILGSSIDSIRYLVKATTEEGCYGTGSILVKVFKTGPDIFVPNAFSPGGGANNLFRPIPVGIATFQYFRVYNRWGQLVFSTTQSGRGWDGSVNGRMQEIGSYVWMVQGISYTGKIIFHKGTMVLIR